MDDVERPDVERQIGRWADAAASAGDGAAAPVGAAEAMAAGRSGRTDTAPGAARHRPALVAAIVLVAIGLAAVGVSLGRGDDDRDQVRAGDPAPTSSSTASTTTTDPAEPPDGPVAFEVLTMVAAGSSTEMGDLRWAALPGELSRLYADVVGPGPIPEVDLTERTVVAVTIPDDACPPTLEGFDRDGAVLTPRFVETATACEEPLVPKTFVVALDWATTGRQFTLHLPADEVHGFGEQRLEIDQARAESVSIELVVPEPSATAGTPIAAEVVVRNDSGAEITGTTCGEIFAVGLRGEGLEQELVFPACASGFSVPEGESRYPVTITTTYTTCTTAADPPEDAVACNPGGQPAIPIGTYETFVHQASGVGPDPEPVTITLR